MKRFHVHIAVDSLQDNIRFYSALFGTEPAISKTDYAIDPAIKKIYLNLRIPAFSAMKNRTV